jgi:hypothetical protein
MDVNMLGLRIPVAARSGVRGDSTDVISMPTSSDGIDLGTSISSCEQVSTTGCAAKAKSSSGSIPLPLPGDDLEDDEDTALSLAIMSDKLGGERPISNSSSVIDGREESSSSGKMDPSTSDQSSDVMLDILCSRNDDDEGCDDCCETADIARRAASV